MQLLRRMVTAGWVDFFGGERPVVILTEEGRQVIHAERPARLLMPPMNTPEFRAKRTRPTTLDPREGFDERAQELFEALRHHRMELARKENVPPYVVASDRTLRDIALMRPDNLEELKLAHGIGPAKGEKYGDGLLAIVRQTT